MQANSGSSDQQPTPMMFITSPMNHAHLNASMGLKRTPYALQFQSKFATPMAVYTNYESKNMGSWVTEETDDDISSDQHAQDYVV